MIKLKHFIERLENLPIGFGLWLVTVLFVIFIRNTVESLVEYQIFPAITSFDVVHVPIFFILSLVSVIVILQLFTGENIIKVSRVALAFLPVIIFLVFGDLLLSFFGIKTLQYGYIFEDVTKHFIHFFNPVHRIPDFPASLRIELAMVCVLSFLYIFVKRQKILRALIGAAAIFITGYIYIALPGIVMALFTHVIYPAYKIFSTKPFGAFLDQRVLEVVQMSIGVVFAGLWYWRYDPVKCLSLIRNLRPLRTLHYAILAVIGVRLFLVTLPEVDAFLWIKILGLLGALFFAFQFSVVINDIYDIKCDQSSNPSRPLICGVFDKKEYLKCGLVFLAFAMLFAFWVSDTCFTIILIFIALYFLYSAPPFQLKRHFITSSLIIGLQALLAFLAGRLSLIYDAIPTISQTDVACLIFIIFTFAASVKDLKDIEGDQLMNVKTLPVIFGEARSRQIIGILLAVNYLIIPLFLKQHVASVLSVIVFSVTFAFANYFYITGKNTKEHGVFILYFIYAILILFQLT